MPKTKKASKKGAKKEPSPSPTRNAAVVTAGESTPEAEDLLLNFLHRVLLWLQNNHARVINLFRKFDNDRDNRLSTDEFFVGMRMMEAPVTKAEIDQLIKIVDTDGDGMMNILDFDKMIRDYQKQVLIRRHSSAVSEDDDELRRSSVSLTFSPSRVSVKCPHCGIGVAEPPAEWNTRYINLKAILAPFKDLKKHPAHAELKVTESTSIHGLKQLIQEHLGGAVDSVALFKEASCNKASFLPPSWCLEHCGLSGGLETDPTSAVVYYDYVPLLGDCPILMNDSHIT